MKVEVTKKEDGKFYVYSETNMGDMDCKGCFKTKKAAIKRAEFCASIMKRPTANSIHQVHIFFNF